MKALSPEAAAVELAASHDRTWLRKFATHVDRIIVTSPLDRLIGSWGLSGAEAAQLFGVSRQAFMKWLQVGPPSDRSPAIAALAAATDLLEHYLKRDRIPAVVRRPAKVLGDKSLIELARDGQYLEVRAAVEAMFDLRRVQP